jgi:hypothetical protein
VYVWCQQTSMAKQLLPDMYGVAAAAEFNCQGFHV